MRPFVASLNLRYFHFVMQLVVMIGVRKSLDFIFTKHELRALDDLMPDSHHKEPKDDEEVNKVISKPTANHS